MSGAILWAFVTAGFWGEQGHYQGFLYYDMEKCEEARPIEEERLRFMGQIVMLTKCVEVRERG